MGATGSAKADRCHICGKVACAGDCKKCPKRLAGECEEVYIAKRIDGVYRWVCSKCYPGLPVNMLD